MSEKVEHEFDQSLVEGAAVLWAHYAEQLSALDRQKIEFDAAELTGFLFNAAHCSCGWCGDLSGENFAAARPLIAVALYLRSTKGWAAQQKQATPFSAAPSPSPHPPGLREVSSGSGK